LLIAPIAAVLVGVAVVGATTPDGTALPPGVAIGTASVPPSPSADGYLISIEELRERGKLASEGVPPYAEAVADLLHWADGAVDDRPSPVEPLVVEGTENPLVDDARRAYGLGLAYGLTGEERYAEAARATIRAYVDTSVATADTCTDNGGCHTSLIIGRVGAGFVFGADLIADSEAWTADDHTRFSAWLKDVLIPAASERINNWGDAGTFLRVVGNDYIGDKAAFDAAIDKWRSLVDLIEADGRIPEEVRRGSAGISYTQEALQYKIAVARIAERRGINLWDYQGAAGGSLRAAIDRLASYWDRPQDWPDHPRAVVPSPGPVWEIAYAHWQDPRWTPIVLDGRPYGDRGHSAIRWTTLTNGIPISPGIAEASGSPLVVPSSQPSAPEASPSASGQPLAGPPVADLTARLSAPLGAKVGVAISWKAGAAGTRFRLERSVDGASWRRLDLASNGHSATDTLTVGTHYEYRVRARKDGLQGPWRTLKGVRVVRVEPSARTVDLSGNWDVIPFGAYSKGVALSTDDAGARLTWRGSARSIAIIGPVGATRGRMTIAVDGRRKDTVDLFASSYHPRVLLSTVQLGGAEEHSLRITAGTVNGRRTVAVDDIVVLQWTLSDVQDSG
jgi:hypothetical protein